MNAKVILACVAALSVGGCATTLTRMHADGISKYVDYAGAPVDRFTAFRMDGWEAVGKNKLVLWTGVNDAYLLTVWDTCRDLQFAQRIGVTSTAHEVSRFETVRVGHEHCPISEIRPVDIKRMKADRAAAKANAVNGSG